MLKEYLQKSLSDNNLCHGWNFLKENVTPELKKVLENSDYWKLDYNRQKEAFILNEFKEELTAEELKQLGSFVYVHNKEKREAEKLEEEQGILNEGYVKIWGSQKELEGKKVKGLFNISTIGLLGSFDDLQEKEGTLTFSERFNSLMLIPKRSRTKGYVIRNFAYIKKSG